MSAGSLAQVDEATWREHRRRISIEVERYRQWCEEHGQPWTLTEKDHEPA